MLIADLRHHMNTEFVVYREFALLCGSNHQALSLLGNLFWWSDVIDKEPHRCGWFYKTADNLKEEIGLTRRGYEKARKFLVGLGILQYKRAGVFGKMHWHLNKEKLLELAYRVRGETPPSLTSKYNHDRDNFRLDSWINLKLWNDYIDMRREKTGKPVKNKQKVALIRQLHDIRGKGLDVAVIMEKAIAAGWAGFYADSNIPSPPAVSSKAEAAAVHGLLKQQTEARDKPPDKDRNPDNPDRHKLLQGIGSKPHGKQ